MNLLTTRPAGEKGKRRGDSRWIGEQYRLGEDICAWKVAGECRKGQHMHIICEGLINMPTGPVGEKGSERRMDSGWIGKHVYWGNGRYSKKGRVMSKGNACKSGNQLYVGV